MRLIRNPNSASSDHLQSDGQVTARLQVVADHSAETSEGRQNGPALPVENRQSPAAPAEHPDLAPITQSDRRGRRKRLVLGGVLAAIVAFGGYEAYRWISVGQYLVSTDDAYVEADVTQLSARATGYVATIVPANTAVKKGDVIMALDDTDYRIALQAAQDKVATQQAALARFDAQIGVQHSAIAQARAQVAAGEAQARRAEADYGRAAALLSTVAGNRQSVDRALAERDQARANVELAKAQVMQAEANLTVVQAQRIEAEKVLAEFRTQIDKAQRDLDYAVLRAPADGVFGNKGVDVGALVQPGTRVGALVPRESLHVTANFKETQLANLQPGQIVKIEVDALDGGEIEGRVESLSPGSGSVFSLLPPENATGNFTKIVQRVPVRIALPSDAHAERVLRAGLSVVVTIDTKAAAKEAAVNTAELKR